MSISPGAPGLNSMPAISQLWKYLATSCANLPCESLTSFGGRVCVYLSQHSLYLPNTYMHSRSSRNEDLQWAGLFLRSITFINLSISILCPFVSHSIPHTPSCQMLLVWNIKIMAFSISYVKICGNWFPPVFCSYHIYFIDIYNSYIHTLYVDAYIYTYVNIRVGIYANICHH